MTTTTFLFLIGKKKLIAVSVIVFFLIIFVTPKSFQTEGTNLLRVASSEQRIESFQLGVKIFQSSPIYGVGFNAYRYAQNRYGLNDAIWQTTHSGAGTDNSFLFVLATTGVVGFLAYIYLLITMFGYAKSNFKKSIYSVVLLSSLTGLIFSSLFINSLFYVFILEWIWVISAITENN